jgi:hypothetical protein
MLQSGAILAARGLAGQGGGEWGYDSNQGARRRAQRGSAVNVPPTQVVDRQGPIVTRTAANEYQARRIPEVMELQCILCRICLAGRAKGARWWREPASIWRVLLAGRAKGARWWSVAASRWRVLLAGRAKGARWWSVAASRWRVLLAGRAKGARWGSRRPSGGFASDSGMQNEGVLRVLSLASAAPTSRTGGPASGTRGFEGSVPEV